LLGRDIDGSSKDVTQTISELFRVADAVTVSCEVIISLALIDTILSSVKLWRVAELNHRMTGAQLPLYVMLHVIVMTSYSCTAPEADKFVVQSVSFSASETTFQSLQHICQTSIIPEGILPNIDMCHFSDGKSL